MNDAETMAADERAKSRMGGIVFVALALLTLAEYFIAVEVESNLTFLIPFVLLKAFLIVTVFMHFGDLITGGHD